MSKAMMKALLPIMAMSAALGDSPYMEHPASSKPSEPFVSRGMPVPRPKTEEEIRRKKEHHKKMQARKKARKGIYDTKIKYKKKRSR